MFNFKDKKFQDVYFNTLKTYFTQGEINQWKNTTLCTKVELHNRKVFNFCFICSMIETWILKFPTKLFVSIFAFYFISSRQIVECIKLSSYQFFATIWNFWISDNAREIKRGDAKCIWSIILSVIYFYCIQCLNPNSIIYLAM